ncbi:putative disulfide formation protein C [Virgibacillus pantothenticus]|uniref:Probable disulfide formation protein n=1 Tax=Virgibacillus pantothenticus TaxID=1473 RepID=A0A0L0QTG4_VIRPA|nr:MULTISPECIES: disulfide oxidoreductase [Virgibacillus]API91064.1 disulfide formation protein [Virgibacillus sp. 6R]KNE21980.1 disulfide formation protein [Virgibacillus pantothenticus]MBS7429053.1 disulfide bond formation protein B [Virgibacillus sp. 19R1-5]MBU8566924.1 disulfide bond formation protein B [Virgibacillus pantothenticus]MBU8600383.1 disulfide bond formation protein B [Virgibacillus pantothenticus]
MVKLSKKEENLLLLIWAQAFVALLGSLFFSEIMGYPPCELCWIQRILMYPLVIIYGVAVFKRDVSMALPGLILSGIGMFVSTYHYLVQKLPALKEAGRACGVVPCNVVYINLLDFITIPFLAGTAFIIIFVLHVSLIRTYKTRN